MAHISRKRELSPSPETLPPAKRVTHEHQDVLGKSTKHCNECNRSYSSERAHKAVCTRKEVSCIYPKLHSECDSQPITLHRVNGSFKCIRCGKLIMKDQNMKKHARECYANTVNRPSEVETSGQPASLPVVSPTPLQDQEPSPFSNPSDEPPLPVAELPRPEAGHTLGDDPISQYEYKTISLSTTGVIPQSGNAAPSSLHTPLEAETSDQPASESSPAVSPTSLQVQEPSPFGSPPDEPPLAVAGVLCPAAGNTLVDEPNPQYKYKATSLSTTCVIPHPALSDLATTSFPASESGTAVAHAPPEPLAELLREANSGRPPRTAVPEHSTKWSWARTPLNEHEACIAPDEHSIIEDPLLRSTPYIVNRKYMTLICTDCGYCVNPEKASQHLRKYHGHCKDGVDFLAQLNTKFPGLVDVIPPLQVVEPVFGLAIPIDMYTICSRCGRGYVNLALWRHHACSKKGIDLEGQPDHYPSLVPVKVPALAQDEAPGDHFDLFKSDFQDLPVCDNTIDEPEDYREINQFLVKEGWINHISGHFRSELLLLIARPSEEEVLKPVIARDVIALMYKIQAAIGKAGYHARQLLGKRPFDNHDGIRTVAHRDI